LRLWVTYPFHAAQQEKANNKCDESKDEQEDVSCNCLECRPILGPDFCPKALLGCFISDNGSNLLALVRSASSLLR
jgi:hypothetical protein